MRPLSERQVESCERAKTKRCRCGCAGSLHGAGRLLAGVSRREFELSPEVDAHRPAPKTENGRTAVVGGM